MRRRKISLKFEKRAAPADPESTWQDYGQLDGIEATPEGVASCLSGVTEETGGQNPQVIAGLLLRQGKLVVEGDSVGYRITII